MKNVNRKLLRELIVEEILIECGCKAAAPDPNDRDWEVFILKL